MKRRVAAAFATVLGVVVIATALARYLAYQALHDRTGCVGDLGVPDLLTGSLRFNDVVLQCPRGSLRFDSLRVDGDLLSGRVNAVAVRGGRVEWSIPSGPQESRSRPGGPRVHPTWTAQDVQVVILREQANLLELHVLHAEGDASRLSFDIDGLRTSESFSPVIRAASASGQLIRDERWRVASLQVDGLDVTLSDAPSLRVAMPPSSETLDESSQPRSGWLGRFTSDAFVEVRQGTVRDAQGISVSALGVRARRSALDTVRFEGGGSPRGSGNLGWNLQVRASTLDVEGNVELERVPLSVFAAFLPEAPVEHTESTLLSGALELHTVDQRVDFDGRLAVLGLTLAHPRLAAEAVGMDVAVSGVGHWDRGAHEVVLERATVGLGQAVVNMAGRVMRDGETYAANVDVSLPSTSCQAAVSSIPRGLLQEVTGWGLDGTIRARAHLEVDSAHLDETQLELEVHEACRFITAPAMADINRFRGPFRHVVNEPDGAVFEMETGPGMPEWTPIYEVSPFLVHSVIAHEDAAFFRHSGFAPWAIRDALVRNLRERRYVLGASTITMQLVKNVFLRREKTLARKVQEVLLTWWIERSMTKEQILELYLNVIEYGPRVYGVRHAASHYFGRTPAELTPAQAAYLAMILPNPPSFYEQYESGAVPASFARRVQRFLSTLRERGCLDEDAFQVGVEELAAMQFSRDGARVGPEIRGACAPLPIAGFSGMPLVEWSEGQPEVDDNEDEPPADDWEVSWP